jgi:Cu-processing system permease protein
MLKILKHILIDILRSKVTIGYTLLLLIVSLSIISLEDSSSKGLLTLLNVLLILIPLMSLVYSTIYFYNSAEFIELLLSQPIKRSTLFIALYLGVTFALLTSFVIGVGIPLVVNDFSAKSALFIACGILLTTIFVSIALLASVVTKDKAKGIGAAIILWVFFTIIYDAIVLLIMFQLSDYPIEKAMISFCTLNPIDLARVLILLKLDNAALMGYTGALFMEFFGNSFGIIFSAIILLCWVAIPFFIALKKFKKKDL